MKLFAKFAREAILNRNGLNHIEIELIPPALTQVTERKPILMILVLDRSGSMSESATGPVGSLNGSRRSESSSKMDYAINASTKFINLLMEKDLFGVVSFDDIATVGQALTAITPSNIHGVIANIRNIHPRGCTNISDALLTAMKQITPDHLEKYNCKIVLISDGLANRGIDHADGLSSIALDCLKDGITVSSLGIGLEYNSGVMGGIAQGGGGLFYHVEDLSKLEEIFKQELNLAAITTAKNVRLLIEVPQNIVVGKNLNSYPQNVNGNHIEILIGDMYTSRKVLLEIWNDFADCDMNFIISANYRSFDGTDRKVKIGVPLKVVSTEQQLNEAVLNREVVESVISLVKKRTIRTTSALYDEGKYFNSFFGIGSTDLMNLSKAYDVNSEDALADLDNLNELYTNHTASKSTAKQLYAESSREIKE